MVVTDCRPPSIDEGACVKILDEAGILPTITQVRRNSNLGCGARYLHPRSELQLIDWVAGTRGVQPVIHGSPNVFPNKTPADKGPTAMLVAQPGTETYAVPSQYEMFPAALRIQGKPPSPMAIWTLLLGLAVLLVADCYTFSNLLLPLVVALSTFHPAGKAVKVP